MTFKPSTFITFLRLLFILICTTNVSSCLVATGSMSYTDGKYLQKTFVSYDKKPDCEIDVFTVRGLPQESFYVIGTCKMEKMETSPNRKQNNIQWFQSCACLAKGDAIIIGEFLEEPDKVGFPALVGKNGNNPNAINPHSSVPNQTISINNPISNRTETISISGSPVSISGGGGKKTTVTQDALSAKVIKYGVEERIY